jgi:oligopeptide transport system substrate-binding protein
MVSDGSAANVPGEQVELGPGGRDPLSRAGLRQLLWLGLTGTVAFVLLMIGLSFAASSTGGASGVRAIDIENNEISVAIRQEPPQMDHTRMTDTVSGMLVGHILEGLLRYDADGSVLPGVAERWDIREDGATFWLREDALWSDGVPVRAQDFVFSWRKTVDPANASQYAFIFYVIRNAEAINTGDMPPETLGVEAVSDRVLEVEFQNPVAYFDKLVAFQTFMPIREDFYLSTNGRYAADAADLLSNGPFILEDWVHGASLRLVKNPLYWNADAIQLDAINVPYITEDANTRMNLFQDGKIAMVDHLPSESLNRVLQQRWPLGRYSDGSVWFLQFNHRSGRIAANYNFRKAMQLVNDRVELVYEVLKVPSYKVADSLFPSWLRGERDFLKAEYPPPEVTINHAEARRHLELARQELGLDEFPPLVLLGDDTPIGVRHSEYMQELLKRTLGLDIVIDRQIFRQRLAKAEAGEFDMVLYGWGPDYDDPLTFGDLFGSWNLNNHGRYANDEIDSAIRTAQTSTDQGVRMQAFDTIQRKLIDDAAILLFYERGVMFVEDARLKGVARRAVGPEPDYTGAFLVDNL